jgi:hypothetical protein
MHHAGRISLIAALISWIALACSLVFGGLTGTVSATWLLHALASGALISAVFAVLFGIAAFARGAQRIAATIGLVLALGFLVTFTGAIWTVIK